MWQQRFFTAIVAMPLITYMMMGRASTTLVCSFFSFMLHSEYTKIISQILKFNSSESDNWYIESMASSIVIRLPTHYILIITAISNTDISLHLHLQLSMFMICFIRIYNFLVTSNYLKNKKQGNMQVPIEFLDRQLYILSFFQIASDLLQFLMFVYPLTFTILSHQYKQGPAMNILWCLLAWQTDNGALFLGKLLGSHPFVPLVSPKKTWEGVSGGIFLSVLTGLVVSQLDVYPFKLLEQMHTKHFLMISLIIAVVSIFGDFCESFLKRVANVKDSGTFFPGHGGVLDRMDSLCFSAPIIYLYMKIFLIDQLQLVD